MPTIPVALQLYSVRKDCEADLPGTLKAVKEAGYEGVEFAGYYGRSAAELRRLLDDHGLKVAGTHTGLATLMSDQLSQTIEFNQAIGNQYLIVPSLPRERRGSRDAWLETARYFNVLAEQLKPLGLRIGYHNHAFEFEPLDGERPIDLLFGNTGPDVVTQFDLGHVARAGANPAAYIARYPGRSATVHLKDYSPNKEAVLFGEGDIDWPKVFRQCETAGGTRWYIVEQETYPYPPLESIRRCRENLRKMGR